MAPSRRAATAEQVVPCELGSADRVWRTLLALAERASAGAPVVGRTGLRWREPSGLEPCEPARADWLVDPDAPRGWRWARDLPLKEEERRAVADLLDLFVPVCAGIGRDHLVIGHLAQSLDGRIATRTGASQFISGTEDLVHTHRLRALCDAVVVGAETVLHDDPRLTTRMAPGANATRVILDPRRRLDAGHRVFNDGAAPTLVLCSDERGGQPPAPGNAELVPIPTARGEMTVDAILSALRAHGLRRIFVEGGGVTVSRFLAANAFDRLHVAVAPVILGSGRSSFTMPPIDELTSALSFDCRHFSCGRDILLDCVLR